MPRKNTRYDNIFVQNQAEQDASTMDSNKRIWSSTEQVFELLKIGRLPKPQLHEIKFQHIRYKKGHQICTSGEQSKHFYIVHTGFLKSSWSDEYGEEKILKFPMRGDIFGLSSLIENKYKNNIYALSDIDLIIVPSKLNYLLGDDTEIFYEKIIEILLTSLISSQHNEYVISKLRAEARVAKFLRLLGAKYKVLGFSDISFNLMMTRKDIGSYLGLTLTTVSRILSEFSATGIITINGKSVQINDLTALQRLRNINFVHSENPAARSELTHKSSSLLDIARPNLPGRGGVNGIGNPGNVIRRKRQAQRIH